MKIDMPANEMVVLSEVFDWIGIKTDVGLFEIIQRDGGLAVLFGHRLVWSSSRDARVVPTAVATACDGKPVIPDVSRPAENMTWSLVNAEAVNLPINTLDAEAAGVRAFLHWLSYLQSPITSDDGKAVWDIMHRKAIALGVFAGGEKTEEGLKS